MARASSLSLVLVFLVVLVKSDPAVDHSILSENVLFYKDGEMSLSSSRWILTLVLDIGVYENFIGKLASDIKMAKNVTVWISKHYSSQRLAGYLSVFQSLQEEILMLENMNIDISRSFLNLKTLKHKQKRALFGFMSGVLGFLFGTLSSSDLDGIRASINILARNQQLISHTLKESLSVLNITRSEISQNRQSINDIIDAIAKIDEELDFVAEELGQQVSEVQEFVHLFATVDRVVEEMRMAIQKSMYYFLRLQVQLNALSTNKLSPSIIEPAEFKMVLKDIETQLPKTFGLPVDIDEELWLLYKHLSCQTLMEDKKIIIIIPIPLIDYSQQMDLYKVYNLPLPISTVYRSKNKTETEMLTYYTLESEYIAINPERTQYMLLNQHDRDICKVGFPKLCTMRKPIHHTNLARMCILAVFSNDKEKIKRLCTTVVAFSNDLPHVQYLSDDTYIIITRVPLNFNLACENEIRQKIDIAVPYGFIRVRKGCKATSDRVTLTGVYEHGSSHTIHNNALSLLQSYNFSNLHIWEPFKTDMPNLKGVVRLPQKLKHLKEIPVDQLLEGMNQVGQVRPLKIQPFPWWGYGLIILGSVTSVIMGILIYHKWGNAIAGCLPAACRESGSRGARAGVLYSGDPGQEMAEISSAEEGSPRPIYRRKNITSGEDVRQQTRALLKKDKQTNQPDQQGPAGGMMRLLPLQPTNQIATDREQ
ncbi:MAG: methyl-accepting chemotaxis protein [Candidatus Thiodiazotropha endolucinida]|nr:methyl-accepting chemotaxis protein [Candidatus Thiodiazotropha taylori]MCW4249017.1 methyl-accepting chemotaxis protein [Candidatus Thiodiazotropha endolucinida]